ncbi:MAG TPA: carbon starvation protein A [Lentisphaeria bacterium]|nr:MAG: carbon starvation protein A [Lentisphaerae bacterium GWF2_50_93]HCE44529.1 carbon starvation protein A [Lentisphaeria bacterium]
MKKLLKIIFWVSLSLIGAVSLAIVAFKRGEPVNALWLVTASVCVFAISYRFYSKWLFTKVFVLDLKRATPSCVKEDGKDYVKTNSWIVFGHHFAAIAGPGPLVGPVLAAQFGYLPGALWILVGAALGGAVHDSMILFCSMRRNGKSLGQMVKEEINSFAGMIALIGIISILIILIAVLALVVVKALAESPWGVFTIAMTIPIALIMGGALRYVCPKRVGYVTAFGVAGLLLSVYLGQYLTHFPAIERMLMLDGKFLAIAIIVYGFAASALPIWLLLAPRDYLSTFMKIGTVIFLAVAVLAIAPQMQMPAITKFIDGTGLVFAGPVFPFCFITIACGAISGFHALISSGTTPKMITSEKCVRTIGYGGMIVEMMVAIMALIAASTMKPGVYFSINMKGEAAAVVKKASDAGFPVTEQEMKALAETLGEKTMIGRTGGAPTFAVGMAEMLSKFFSGSTAMALWYHFAIMFEALFILTTIDAGTRVGRFLMQDLLGQITPMLGQNGTHLSSITSSLIFCGAWGWFLIQGVIDPLGGINSLWPIFGIANQLLAVIALSLGTTILIKMGKARYIWVTLLPLVWLSAVTMTAGFMKIFSASPKLGFLSNAKEISDKIAGGGTTKQILEWETLMFNNYVNAAVSAIFMILVVLIVCACVREWYLLLSKKKLPVLHESPYVELETV